MSSGLPTDDFIVLLTLLETKKPGIVECCLTKRRKKPSTHPQNRLDRLHGIGDYGGNCFGYCTNDEHIQRGKLESKDRMNHTDPNNRTVQR